MTAAFMWRLAKGDDVAYLVLNQYIVAQILVNGGAWAGATVEAYGGLSGGLSLAHAQALTLTEYLEIRGFRLDATYVHHNPTDSHIPSQMLRLLSYYTAGDFTQVRAVCGQVTSTFYTTAEEVT